MGDEEADIIDAIESSGSTIKGRKAQKKKVPAEKFSASLTDIKLVHIAQIPWGTLYGVPSNGCTVMEFAWADAQVVLFMSTVHHGKLAIFRSSTPRIFPADVIHRQVRITSSSVANDQPRPLQTPKISARRSRARTRRK
jgi:hypothetical protein